MTYSMIVLENININFIKKIKKIYSTYPGITVPFYPSLPVTSIGLSINIPSGPVIF